MTSLGLRKSILAALAILAMLLSSPAGTVAGGASVTLSPMPAEAAAGPAPVTFGVVFGPGDIAKGKAIVVRMAGQEVAAQVDVKRHYDDGSARFAIVSLMLPKLDVNTVVECQAGDAKADAAPANAKSDDAAKALLATNFDAVVTLTFPDGKSVSASARKMLEAAGDKAEKWLVGPVVTEWLLMGPPADAQGKADPDLNVQFQVRSYDNAKAVRVSVVVENCSDTWAGNIGYDVDIMLGQPAKDGQAALTKKGVDHERASRWRKVLWWPAEPAQVHVAHDLAQLTATKALPNYDTTIKIPEKDLAGLASGWAKCQGDLMGNGFLMKYGPSTGGRGEIGPYPSWTVQYLLSMDERAKRAVLGNADLAGSWPMHVRAAKTGHIMTIDDRPKFWYDGRGQDKPKWQPDRKPIEGKGLELTPDVTAHVGSYAYVPYLVTGDYYYLEEAYFWANAALLSTNPDLGRSQAKGLVLDSQTRGVAWALRNLADAAFIAPDDSMEAKYFEEKVRNNIATLTHIMYGPPERNSMGFWGSEGNVDTYREHNPANPNWIFIAPWQNSFVTWGLNHLVELGYADAAKPRDFQLRWQIGLFTHPGEFDPVRGAVYHLVIGEQEKAPGSKIVYYEDWKKLNDENAKLTPKAQIGGEYAWAVRTALMCGIDGDVPKADEALKVLESLVPGFKAQPDLHWVFLPRPKLAGK